MTQPKKTDYGYSGLTFWENGDLKGYMKAYAEWEARPRLVSSGRKRSREIHPSWLPYLKYFTPTNPAKSQRAFCRFAGIDTASFSNAKCKPITNSMEVKLSEWIEEQAKTEQHEQQQ